MKSENILRAHFEADRFPRSSLLRITLLGVMVFCISMPAMNIAQGSEARANAASGTSGSDLASTPASQSDARVKSDGAKDPSTSGTGNEAQIVDVPAETQDASIPVIVEEVDSTDEPNESDLPSSEVIPEVEDEVESTDDIVEPPAPVEPVNEPGASVVPNDEQTDPATGTVERAPPTETAIAMEESHPVVETIDDVSLEPTETAIPSEPQPTPEPTEAPSPTSTPAPTPTAEPAIPFNPELVCVPAPGSEAPVQGAGNWSYLDCEIKWETTDVSSASILPIGPEIQWDVVALTDRATQNPDNLVLNPKPVNLFDANPSDDGFYSGRFHLAMRVSCVDPTAVTIPLQFQTTSGEDALREMATKPLPISASEATLPEVELTSAVFGNVNPPDGIEVSTGVISMNYRNASQSCGWKITTSVDDFVAGDDVLPASELSLVNVVGPDGLTSSIEEGEITISAAPGVSMPASGALTITVTLPVPETVSSGVYSTTITADAGAP